MDIDEYNDRQRSITNEVVSLFLRIVETFQTPQLDERGWFSLLSALFPQIQEYRRRSAVLGREFYDSQRRQHMGERFNMYLATYEFSWFVEAMRPVKRDFMRPGTSNDAVSRAAMRVAKEVENGGRRTILRPIQDEDVQDPEVKGWARVATGRETCGFCLMLVSRGPVYQSAETAGLDADDTSALDLIAEGNTEALNDAMTRWHPDCDCKVVPVFDRKNWPGRDAYLEADQMWRNVTQGYKGKDALNALRRALYSNEVPSEDLAVAA